MTPAATQEPPRSASPTPHGQASRPLTVQGTHEEVQSADAIGVAIAGVDAAAACAPAEFFLRQVRGRTLPPTGCLRRQSRVTANTSLDPLNPHPQPP
jgi:hypothetical protein